MRAQLPFSLRLRSGVAALCLVSACAQTTHLPPSHEAPLAGRILDTRTGAIISREAAIARAVAAPILILGEAHDNAEHHRLQVELLDALLGAGRRPVLAMEQFDREQQAALDAVRARGERDAERIADAGRFDRKAWIWPDYKPLVERALSAGLELRAANLSREDARVLMRSGRPAPGLPAAPPALRAALEKDLVDGHCGHRPAAGLLSGMVEAQRARDAQMAKALENTGTRGAVLIAGAAHARRDLGVPLYFSAEARVRTLVIGFLETEKGEIPSVLRGEYDLVWFTLRAAREDPCAGFRPFTNQPRG